MSMKQALKRAAVAGAVVVGGLGLGMTDEANAQATGGCTTQGCQGGGTPPVVTPPTGGNTTNTNTNNNNNSNTNNNWNNNSNTNVNTATGGNATATGGNASQSQGQSQSMSNSQSTTFKGAASGSVAVVGGSGQCNSGFAVGFGTFSATGSFSFTKQDRTCLDHQTIQVGLANGIAFRQNTVTAVSLATWSEISKEAQRGLSIVHAQASKCGTNVDPIFLAVKGGCGSSQQYTQKQTQWKPKKVRVTNKDKVFNRQIKECKCAL